MRRAADFKQPIEIDLWGIHSCDLYFSWQQNTIGFGQLSLSVSRDGDSVRIKADTEGMSREWVRRALHALADKIADSFPPASEETRYHLDHVIPIPAGVLEHWRKFEREIQADQPDADKSTAPEGLTP